MAMWTADKFVNPAHSGAVMENFYGLPALGSEMFVVLGVIQAVIVSLFVTGTLRGYSYGAVLLMHGASTLSLGGNISTASTTCSSSPPGRCWRPVSPCSCFAPMTGCCRWMRCANAES